MAPRPPYVYTKPTPITLFDQFGNPVTVVSGSLGVNVTGGNLSTLSAIGGTEITTSEILKALLVEARVQSYYLSEILANLTQMNSLTGQGTQDDPDRLRVEFERETSLTLLATP